MAGNARNPSTDESLPSSSSQVRAGAASDASPVEWAGFDARLRNAVGDTTEILERLYPGRGLQVQDRLRARARSIFVDRPVALRALDAERLSDPAWFQREDQIGYVAYAEKFAGDLHGVRERLDYFCEFGVRYLHLMKVLHPRDEPNDGGFAVLDYRAVDPLLGTMSDLASLATELRDRRISLCVDLVMNHTAKEHEWARKARRGDQRYRDYFHVFSDRADVDAFEATLPEVFPEIAPGNFTWCDELNGWVWTTFNTYQWDLNYANPDVLLEMFENIGFLINQGIDVLRLDAVAFTWKRRGTDCQNQPEAHWIVQALRSFLRCAAPGVLLKAEAIVGPRELTAYLGAHERERAECHVAYHNQLMVNIWSSLASRDALVMTNAMANLAQAPTNTGWMTYLRCHDDIGWAIDDDDAAGVAVSGEAHRRFLAEFYRGEFPGTFAHGVAFSTNEMTGDERTCGMAATLTGIRHAVTSGDTHAQSLGVRRLLLGYGLVASFGTPLVYMGDEIALGDDNTYAQNPLRADDSRWMHRPAMDWAAAERRNVAGTIECEVFEGLRAILSTRTRLPAMRQGGRVDIFRTGENRVFAFARHHPVAGTLLGLANFSEADASVTTDVFAWASVPQSAPDHLRSGARIAGTRVIVPPLRLAWFSADSSVRNQP